MSYGTVAGVQANIPKQFIGQAGFSAESQPTRTQVTSWVTAQSAFIDSSLRWKYSVPITNATDVATLTVICEMLVAAQVWSVLAGHSAEASATAKQLRESALTMLAYNSREGRSYLVLPNSATSDSGEADVGSPEGSFTDPDSTGEDVNPRMFTLRTEF